MKTVAIVGSEKRTRDLAPWNDQSIDIWVFNEAAQSEWAKRVTGVFQLHVPAVYRNPLNRSDPRHWEWLQQPHPFPIWMIDVDPEVPASVRYPLKEILFYMPCDPGMFGSSVSYGFALALFKGYEKILIYGSEMDYLTEYRKQRESLCYWYGFAQGYGVTVERHCMESIFDNKFYGRDGVVNHNPEDYQKRAVYLETQLRNKKRRFELLMKAKGVQINDLSKAAVDYGTVEGQAMENQRYLEKVKGMIAATGSAPLDASEFEFMARSITPLIEKARDKAVQMYGAKDVKGFLQATLDAAILTGRWKENNHLLQGMKDDHN